MQHFARLVTAGSNLNGSRKTLGRKEMLMQIALGVSFVMIAAAPFVGRWRANVWLKKHTSNDRVVNSVPGVA